jgi:hypothetical protein
MLMSIKHKTTQIKIKLTVPAMEKKPLLKSSAGIQMSRQKLTEQVTMATVNLQTIKIRRNCHVSCLHKITQHFFFILIGHLATISEAGWVENTLCRHLLVMCRRGQGSVRKVSNVSKLCVCDVEQALNNTSTILFSYNKHYSIGYHGTYITFL